VKKGNEIDKRMRIVMNASLGSITLTSRTLYNKGLFDNCGTLHVDLNLQYVFFLPKESIEHVTTVYINSGDSNVRSAYHQYNKNTVDCYCTSGLRLS
jgi:hypothetical protein